MSEKTKYCHNCGAMIPYYDRYCPACGEEQPTLPGMIDVEVRGGKKVWVAVLLSFLVTGLGQFYLGKRRRALIFFFGTLLLGVVLSFSFDQNQLMVIGLIIALFSAIDAYQLASKERLSI